MSGCVDRARWWVCLCLLFAGMPARSFSNALLEPVIASLPDIPLVVSGDLQKRDARGRIETTYRVEMVLDWKANVPTARYTIRDHFGASLQHLAITWSNPVRPEYRFLEGSPLRAAPLPPLGDAILDTDLSWIDLSLSFLWWDGGVEQGEEPVRGRDCRVIDLPAPDSVGNKMDGIRLWVDRKAGMVLRAEGYDASGELMRRMDVKSFKKINDRWVIKDIDFQRFPEKSKTTLLVRDVKERDRFYTPERDAGGDVEEQLDATRLVPVNDASE